MSARRAALAVVAAGALALGATACGSDEVDSAPVMAADGSGPLEFSAPLVGGGSFEGASYGERPVAFWFWAPG